MGRVIRLRGSEHERVQALLPWRAVGALEPEDDALVEAHLATCAECQADLAMERRLSAAFQDLPLETAEAWSAPLRPRRPRMAIRAPRWLSGAGPWLGWALAGPALAALTLVLVAPPREPAARYHALGAASAPAEGNIVVMFKPDATEQAMRRALNASGARLAGGPTAADAYLLHAPTAQRPATLAQLRREPIVTLAEPIDSGGPP